MLSKLANKSTQKSSIFPTKANFERSLKLKNGLMDIGVVVESAMCEPFQKVEIQNGHFHLYSKTGAIGQGVYVDHINKLFVNQLADAYPKKFKKKLVILQEFDSW